MCAVANVGVQVSACHRQPHRESDTAAQATEHVHLAHQHCCVLQVGQVERFNPVFKYLEQIATEPRFIETHRLSPYPARSTDIDVVLAFVKSPVTSVDAVGIPVLSKSEDIANARLRFANGCVANLTASRVSPERMRKIRVFSGGAATSYISLDYRAQEGFIYRVARDGEEESSLLKKSFGRETWCGQRVHNRQRIRRQTNRARAGADRERRTAQVGVATFRRVRARATNPCGQRGICQARAGPGI